MSDWTVFSNHGHVLVCLARHGEARLRDVAASVGITERAVQKIVKELQDAGFVAVTKHGRCNRYRINPRKSLRHALESSCTVGRLLQALNVASATEEPDAEATPEPATPAPPTRKSAPPAGKSPARAEPAPQTPRPTGTDAPPARATRKAATKPDSKDGPPDSSQQGSLF